MPSTHLSLRYHIVFGTKNHEPIIWAAWRGKLHACPGAIIRTADGIGIWTYCGAAAWNLMSVMSDSVAPAGAW
jgi:hypothetical protein